MQNLVKAEQLKSAKANPEFSSEPANMQSYIVLVNFDLNISITSPLAQLYLRKSATFSRKQQI